VQVETWVNDGSWDDCSSEEDIIYDWRSSSIYQVYATLTMEAEDEDEADWTWDILLAYDYTEGCDDPEGWMRYSQGIWFYNTADEAEYTVTFWAVDYAGNWASDDAFTADNMITVEFDTELTTTNGGAFSCQTLDVYLTSDIYAEVEVTVTADTESEYVVLYATCTEKDETNTNYVAVAFTSEEYDAFGTTDPVTMTIWSTGAGRAVNSGINGMPGNFGITVNYQSYSEDSWNYHMLPGTSVFAGLWSSSIVIPPATPDNTDFMLSELDTITATGAIQNYNLAAGSAASVVPSVFAVLFALLALLRL
jgi:hypothetical protein